MMLRLPALLLALATCLSASVCSLAAAGAEPRPLVLATYNVQNYTSAARRLPDGFRPEYPKPEAEKTALRTVLRRIDADVLVLQEMGGPGYLAELRRDLASEGAAYPFGECMVAADEARGLAVLSRLPLGTITAHRDLHTRRRGTEEPAAVRRGLLQVELLSPDGPPLSLFVVHLKSRLAADRDDPQAEDQRVAEAQAVRDRILQLYPDPETSRFLIVGDFNDLPGSRTLQAFQSRGKTTLSTWLDAADSRGHRWTHAYERLGLYSRFDQIFASGGIAPAVARTWIADFPEVAAASDHRPLVVELKLTPPATD